jgi:hypothetical protein
VGGIYCCAVLCSCLLLLSNLGEQRVSEGLDLRKLDLDVLLHCSLVGREGPIHTLFLGQVGQLLLVGIVGLDNLDVLVVVGLSVL